jgi:hypothetical protein
MDEAIEVGKRSKKYLDRTTTVSNVPKPKPGLRGVMIWDELRKAEREAYNVVRAALQGSAWLPDRDVRRTRLRAL